MAKSTMSSPTPTLRSSTDEHPKKASSPTPSTHEKEVKTKGKVTGPPPGVGGMQAPLELPKWRFWAIFISILFSIFLFALDQLIVATAIPKITAEFDSLTKLSWLASGFFLTLLGFNLIYSQLNQVFPSKHVMLLAILIFEVGSVVCGAAPNMDVLILGRAIAGLGAAGLFSGAMIIVAELTPLHNRAQYFGLIGVCFAVASVIGPLVGGAFSDHVSWRWCFYINLPFGGIAMACILIFQPTTPPLGRAATYKGYNRAMIWQVAKCDWLGAAIVMGWGCCIILFMQWGGVTKSWSSGPVITTIVLSAVLPVVFFLYEWWIGENAMFKLHLMKRRSVVGPSIVLFMLFAVFMIEVYYLAVAFQAAYHLSATAAGIRLLPLILVQVFVLMASSRVIPLLGRFKWVIVAGPCFLCLACGLLYTVKYGTPISHLYGFQVLLGIGIGLGLQNSMIAVQFELKSEPWLISAGTGTAVFIGFAGRIIGISLAGSVFENMIQVNMKKYVPTLPEHLVQEVVNSATAIWDEIPAEFQQDVLVAYTETLRVVYILGLPFAFLGFLAALVIKNSKMQTKEEENAAIQAAKEKEAGDKETAVKDVEAEDEAKQEKEAGWAEATAAVAPQPEATTERIPAVDSQAALAKHDGKSPV